MLKIDKEESDNDSDRPTAKSVPNTPSKGQAPDGSATHTGNGGDASVYINNSASTLNMPVFPNKVSIFIVLCKHSCGVSQRCLLSTLNLN